MNNFQKLETEAGDIFYYGDRSFPGRPTAIFLHGLSSNHTTWTKIMQVLYEHKYNGLALDLRGHGLSDKRMERGLYSLDRFALDLAAIIRKEKIENFILVGYSFGGAVALEYATTANPSPSGLVLISSNHVNPFRYRGIDFLSPLARGIAQFLALIFRVQRKKKYLDYRHQETRGYWHSVWEGLRTMPLSVNLWMLLEMGKLDFRKRIGRIEIPTVLFYAKNDPFVTEREIKDMMKEMKRSKAVTSKNPSHFIATDCQEEVAEIILDFLKTI